MSDRDLILNIKEICSDIERIFDGEATWKDADPSLWPQLDRNFSQHQSALCQAAKNDAARAPICGQHCSYPNTGSDQACLVNCPYGVRELRLPLYLGQRYLGTLAIGPWRGAKGNNYPKDLFRLFNQLPKRDDNYAMALARCIQSRLQLAALKQQQNTHTSSHDERLEQCFRYINQHAHLQLRASSVAKVLSISTSRFIHWFKEATGTTYRQYVQQLVLQQAAVALLQPKSRILDIALDCGYHTPSAFSAAFKQEFGMQPSAFRKQQLQRI